MKRREMLRLAAGTGALAVAGCTSSAGDPTDGAPSQSERTDRSTDGPGETAITGTSVTTRGRECLSGETGTTDISFESGRVVVTGVVRASTPCHDAVLRDATYDAGADRLAVDVGTESDGSTACEQCIGGISYRVVVEFAGPVPRAASVAHHGRGVASAAHGSSAATPPDEEPTDDGASGTGDTGSGSDGSPPTLQGSSLSVVDVSSSASETTATIGFESGTNTVRIRGTIQGSDGCKTAALGSVDYDASAGTLAVDVVTENREGSEGRACTKALVFIDYEVTVEFAGGLPREVSVSHDGTGVAGAARASGSAGSGG